MVRVRSKKAMVVCSKCLLVFLFNSICTKNWAQDIESTRFFKLNLNTLSSPNSYFSQSPYSTSASFPAQNIEPAQLIEAELRFPIQITGPTKWIGRLSYDQEFLTGFYFNPGETDQQALDFHRSQLSLTVLHEFNERFFLTTDLSLTSRSNQFLAFGNQSFIIRNTFLFESRQKGISIGLGASTGYSSNRFTFLPLLKYKKDLSRNWQLDFLLPAKLLAIKKLDKRNRLLFGLKGNTATYFFDDQLENTPTNVEYRRLNVNLIAGYERMLSPLVGIGLEMGATRNLQSGLYQLEDRRIEIHNFGRSVEPYFNLKFFLALPK